MINNVELKKSVDYLFGAIHLLLPRNKPKPVPRKPRRILFIRAWAMGATLLTLPTLKLLREAYPEAEIEVLTINTGEIFKRSIKRVKISKLSIKWLISKMLKPKSYDIIIDTEDFSNISAIISRWLGKTSIGFGYLARSRAYNYAIKFNDKQHYVYIFAKLLEPLGIKKKPRRLIPLKYTKKEKKKIDQLLSKYKGKILIGIHAGGGSTAQQRLWPKERFKELIEKLLRDPRIVVYLTGTNSEKDINKYIKKRIQNKRLIDLTNKLNIGELAYLLTKTRLFISNDTGPMHLAAAMNVKTIGLFGPNLPERFAPFPPSKHIAIYKARDLSCSPCINVHLRQLGNTKCDGKCMKLIKVEDVWRKVKKDL
ncbi:glycosyltransferase family 9 protein [Candidatus Woesearchaeota archaeon]|nr:glycosyltransferase family 9 protein [Candidatus Woesearchaeota archaeon]